MCGIAGLSRPGAIGQMRDAVVAATNAAEHRGPDGYGFGIYDSVEGRVVRVGLNASATRPAEAGVGDVMLGHRRLAIIDLTDSGLQPMSNEDETLWIIFNGEIYNYVELRDELRALGHPFKTNSDTEVILHAYEQWGEAAVSRFNGMWAFALLDLRRRRLLCSRDRFGVKPLHYFYDGQSFAFASEIKQLLCMPFIPKAANERALYEFLAYAATDYCEETFFAGINKLLHGHNLVFDLASRALSVRRYYDPALAVNDRAQPGEAARAFESVFDDSIRLRLRSDVEVGSCLSGGLDSSSIVTVMRERLAREGKTEVQRTFTSHFDEPEANELDYTRAVIEATGVNASVVRPKPSDFRSALDKMVWHQEEPFASTSIFAQWCVYQSAHEGGVKVMLDGQGADEQLAGYLGLVPVYLRELQARADWLRLWWERWRFSRHAMRDGRNGARVRPMVQPADGASWLLPSFAQRFVGQERFLQNQRVQPFGERELLNNTLYQLMFLNNLQALLRYADRSSMAFSVEARLPFLDYRLVEYTFSLPSRLKIRGGYTKRVLRDGVGRRLPRAVRWRTSKLGFATPEQTWQHGMLKDLASEAATAGTLEGMVDPKAAQIYAERAADSTTLDSTPWRWTSVHLWKRSFGIS